MARENGLALLWDNTPCRAAGPFHANVTAPLSQIRQEFRVAARVHQSHLTQSPLGSINRFMPDHPSLSQAFLPFNKAFINTHGYHVPLPRLPSHNQPNTSTSPSNKNYHHLQTWASGYPWAERREYWLGRSKREHCKALEMFKMLILVIGEYICKKLLTCKLKTSTLFCKYITPHFKNLLMKKTVISDQHLFCRALYTVTLLSPSMLHAPLPSALHHSSASGDQGNSNCDMHNIAVQRSGLRG